MVLIRTHAVGCCCVPRAAREGHGAWFPVQVDSYNAAVPNPNAAVASLSPTATVAVPQALNLFRRKTGRTQRFKVDLQKRVPHGAGGKRSVLRWVVQSQQPCLCWLDQRACRLRARSPRHCSLVPCTGLGGGSGNAATTLWAANELCGRPASNEELLEVRGLLCLLCISLLLRLSPFCCC